MRPSANFLKCLFLVFIICNCSFLRVVARIGSGYGVGPILAAGLIVKLLGSNNQMTGSIRERVVQHHGKLYRHVGYHHESRIPLLGQDDMWDWDENDASDRHPLLFQTEDSNLWEDDLRGWGRARNYMNYDAYPPYIFKKDFMNPFSPLYRYDDFLWRR